MNQTLPQSVVDDAMAEDMQASKSEYLGEFRDDVGEYLPRAVIERVVVSGRGHLLPRREIQYRAFADLSGGRGDDAALAIAHKVGNTVVIDFAKRYRPPFSPQDVCREMADEVKRYGIKRITGDNYAAEFVARAFVGNGIRYIKADKPKSILYAELLPRLCSGEIELPDDEFLVSQLAGLEWRTRSGMVDRPRLRTIITSGNRLLPSPAKAKQTNRPHSKQNKRRRFRDDRLIWRIRQTA